MPQDEAVLQTEPPLLPLPEAPLPEAPLPEEPEPDIVAPPVEELTEEDFDRGDVAVLEGCWELDSDYRIINDATRESILFGQWTICFDTNGRGVERMRAEDGNTCVGPVAGTFGNNVLRIVEPDNLSCSGGFQIYRREIDCSLDGRGLAQCTVRQPEVNTTSTARLRRSVGEK